MQTVDDQRLFEQLGNSPIDWQVSPDPYLGVLASSAFASFQALENKIIASPPGRAPGDLGGLAGRRRIGHPRDSAPPRPPSGSNVTSGIGRASGDIVLLRLILVGGAGLLAVIVSSVLLLGFGNRISRELTGLRGAARTLADERLPSVVSRLRAGDDVDVAAEAPPLALARGPGR